MQKVNQNFQNKENSKDQKPLRQMGGTYFHSGAIIGRKNIFVTSEYIDLLVNAFKTAELKMDIKNLAYVIMPNYFYWMFRLNAKQDDPVKIYGEVKKTVASEIHRNLINEIKNGEYKLADLFVGNERVGRSAPERILGSFEAFADSFEKNKQYRVWAPKTEIRLIDTADLLNQKLEVIKKAPVSDRWQFVADATDYPYLFIAEELAGGAEDECRLVPVIEKRLIREKVTA